MALTGYEKDILEDMLIHRIIGGKHASVTNLIKGHEKHLLGDVKKALNNLIKMGFIQTKPTAYGLEASLDPERLEDIRDFLLKQQPL